MGTQQACLVHDFRPLIPCKPISNWLEIWSPSTWLAGITYSTDMSLSELQEMANDKDVWWVAVRGVTESQTWLNTNVSPLRPESGHLESDGVSAMGGSQSPELRIPSVIPPLVPCWPPLGETHCPRSWLMGFCQAINKFSFVSIPHLMVIFPLCLTILIESESQDIMKR